MDLMDYKLYFIEDRYTERVDYDQLVEAFVSEVLFRKAMREAAYVTYR